MNLGDAAVGIASQLGWAVFPCYWTTGDRCSCCDPDCPSLGKHPCTRRGLHAATTTTDLIGRWWQRCPRFNIGVNCGASGLLVVDCDVKNDVDGLAAWLELGSDHGGWVDTLVVSTASGGEHWYFTLEPGWAIGSTAGKLAPGIDVRARGGYVIAPPSVVCDGTYDVLSDNPVAPAPEWLIGLLVEPVAPRLPPVPAPGRAGNYGLRALEGELGRLALAPEGQRNDSLVKAAYRLGQLAAGGHLDTGDVASQLLAVALRIGLSEREATGTIRSGMTAGARTPRSAA